MSRLAQTIILIFLLSIVLINVEGFGIPCRISKVTRSANKHVAAGTKYGGSTRLSSNLIDFTQTSLLISVQAQLEAYEKQGVPSIVLPLIVSLIVGTILLPLTARKFQRSRNTRSAAEKGVLKEPEDAAGAYEKYYKKDAVNDGSQL